MKDTKNYQPTQVIKVKDIQNLLIVSLSTAQRYYSDIKNTYNVKQVLYQHFINYFKIG